MSEILKDRAVILRGFEFGESSIIAVSLTMNHGKLRFLAKGAKKNRSPFHGGLRTGNMAEIVYYNKPQRGLQLLKEITSHPVFDTDIRDLDRVCIFQAGLEVIDRTTIEHESDSRVFTVLEDFIGALGSCEDPWTPFFVLQVRLAGIAGLLPDFEECGTCKKALAGKSMNIDPSSGAVLCDGCSCGGALSVSSASADLLRAMKERGLGETEQAVCDFIQRREIGRILHNLFLHHFDAYRLPNALKILKGVD